MQYHLNGEKLETVTQFKNLGASITDDAKSMQEINIRIAVAKGIPCKVAGHLEG